MSEEEAKLSRKERKAQRDAERAAKGKKRKHDETEEADTVPGDDGAKEAEVKPAEKSKKDKKEKNSKKRKAEPEDNETDGKDTEDAAQGEAQPKKKRRKGKSEEDKPSKNRFIVFVGNLPYKTTDATLDKHFAKLKPFTLRHRTDPATKRSKGFAFLEFENYDRMKTCLKIYHHSMFDPVAIENGEAPIEPGTEVVQESQVDAFKNRNRKKKDTARKINVELTAGGGGTTEARKEKIKTKNVRLDEQRVRRAEEERKQKERKAKKDALSGKKEGKDKGEKKQSIVKELEQKAAAAPESTEGIHPARLAMMGRR